MSDKSEYGKTGVDVEKKGIEAFRGEVENMFPDAFCVVTQDPDFPAYGNILHSDGAGSKPVQTYIHWKETGNDSVVGWLANDAIAMNLGDTDCVGAYPISFVDYIAINGFYVPKIEFLREISKGFGKALSTLSKHGINIAFAGGETADLPDQLRTVDVSGTIYARLKLDEAITGENIAPGDVIVGLASGGRAKYEDRINSGHMCNGITLTRHCLMTPEYEDEYPEIRALEGAPYSGKYRTTDFLTDLGMSVGEAIISPTRLFSPIIRDVLKQHGKDIHGMTQNTGGGQTKCLRLGSNVRYVKDALPDPEPIFHLVQQESGENWKNMHKNYNMGVGFDLIVPESIARSVMDIAKGYGVRAWRTGYVEEMDGKELVIDAPRFGRFVYD